MPHARRMLASARGSLVVATLAVGTLLAARVAPAQGPGATPSACLDSLPPDIFTRVSVYAEAEPRDSAARALLPVADLLTAAAAERVRAMLGARPGELLPVGEPAITWRDLGPGLWVTLHRDGSFTWATAPDDEPAGDGEPGRTAATDSLARALASMREAGERLFWPAEVAGDSLGFRIALRRPTVSHGGSAVARRTRRPVPLASVAAPWETPVVVVRPPRIPYPQHLRRGGVTGVLVLRYVVDERGQVDPETVRDEWPADRPRQTGELGRHYRDFMAAVRRGLASARFEPARVGGCAVRRLVEQPFHFDLR